VPSISVPNLELYPHQLIIFAVWKSTNHNHRCCISQLWEVTMDYGCPAHSHICCRLLVPLPWILPRLPNVDCTYLHTYHNPISSNPGSRFKNFQRKPAFKSLQKFCNCQLPVHGSMSHLFQLVWSPDYGLMLLLLRPSDPYLLPLLERTKLRLIHSFGKLLQGEFHVLQADWGFGFHPTQVQRIVTLIICTVFVIGNLWYYGQIGRPCNICPSQFLSQLK
jgi:hypothetical protein